MKKIPYHISTAIDLLTKYYSKQYNDFYSKTKEMGKNGEYYSIPSPASYLEKLLFLLYIIKQKSKKPIKFLDIGAGPGNVVNFASLFVVAKGVERLPISEMVTSSFNVKYNTNVFDVKDFGDKNEQLIVYMYRPIQDTEGVLKLFKHVYDNVPKGTIFILNYMDEIITLMKLKTFNVPYEYKQFDSKFVHKKSALYFVK